MSVLLSVADSVQALLDEGDIEAAVQAVMDEEGIDRAVEVSVSFVDDATIHELNAAWRGIDAPTDVLSFACDSPSDAQIPADMAVELGDVILAPAVIEAQAPKFGNTPEAECRLMLVHGLLHLLGYDHMDEKHALEMEAHELAVLRALAAARGDDPETVAIGPTTRHEFD